MPRPSELRQPSRPSTVRIPYNPRPQQWAVHKALETSRFAVLVCHRRFGKTVLAINALVASAVHCRRDNPRFAYIAPTFTQAKDIAWTYLKDYTRDIPGTRFLESELTVILPTGARIRLYGADNPDRLRGLYFDGVVFDEFGDMDPEVWSAVVRPALADRKGWALFIGTPKGKNHFSDLYLSAQADDGWFSGMYKASETGLIDDEELAAARRSMSEDLYAQEFECSFEAAIRGAYYAHDIAEAREDGRIIGRLYDKHLPVWTAWDLGIDDATAIWFFQVMRNEIRWIDYEEESGEALPFYAKLLADKPYIYEGHILPHDVKVRELSTGRSRMDTLSDLGLKGIEVAPRMNPGDGINAARVILARSWFDIDHCARGIECLDNYRKEWDAKRQVFKPHPLHDWSSHGADAFRYGASMIDFNEAVDDVRHEARQHGRNARTGY